MTINMNGYTINNVPAYAMGHSYIVARLCDDSLWFYGAWDNMEKAVEVAEAIGGAVIPMDC